jgi:hypothetical protein
MCWIVGWSGVYEGSYLTGCNETGREEIQSLQIHSHAVDSYHTNQNTLIILESQNLNAELQKE